MIGWVMWNVRWEREMHTVFVVVQLAGRDHLEDLVLEGSIKIKMNLKGIE